MNHPTLPPEAVIPRRHRDIEDMEGSGVHTRRLDGGLPREK